MYKMAKRWYTIQTIMDLLWTNMEHTTLLYIYSPHILIFLFQICTFQTMCKFGIKKEVCVVKKCIIVLCVPRLMSGVDEMDYLREETVPLSGCSGFQSSVASTRR